jgi:hypothetical protein
VARALAQGLRWGGNPAGNHRTWPGSSLPAKPASFQKPSVLNPNPDQRWVFQLLERPSQNLETGKRVIDCCPSTANPRMTVQAFLAKKHLIISFRRQLVIRTGYQSIA